MAYAFVSSSLVHPLKDVAEQHTMVLGDVRVGRKCREEGVMVVPRYQLLQYLARLGTQRTVLQPATQAHELGIFTSS
jgi:hypothetical protein